MKISVIGAVTGDNYVCAVDELDEIESAFGQIFSPLPDELQAAINAKYGTLATRQQGKTAFIARLNALNAAIAATDDNLPAAAVANLAAVNGIINELNAIRNRQNAVLRMLRYIYLHQ